MESNFMNDIQGIDCDKINGDNSKDSVPKIDKFDYIETNKLNLSSMPIVQHVE